MHLIVGLGNPGLIYQKSRHNAGFLAIDALTLKTGIKVQKRAHRSLLGEGFYKGEKLLLVKPQTYMNLSGEAVQALLHFYKQPIENLIVIYDDIDLPAGGLRLRGAGSAGTHNGMRSIIACLGGETGFPRVRIGMGRQEGGKELSAHVLGKPAKEEQGLIDEAVDKAADAALMIALGDLLGAQAKYNQKPQKGQNEKENA